MIEISVPFRWNCNACSGYGIFTYVCILKFYVVSIAYVGAFDLLVWLFFFFFFFYSSHSFFFYWFNSSLVVLFFSRYFFSQIFSSASVKSIRPNKKMREKKQIHAQYYHKWINVLFLILFPFHFTWLYPIDVWFFCSSQKLIQLKFLTIFFFFFKKNLSFLFFGFQMLILLHLMNISHILFIRLVELFLTIRVLSFHQSFKMAVQWASYKQSDLYLTERYILRVLWWLSAQIFPFPWLNLVIQMVTANPSAIII